MNLWRSWGLMKSIELVGEGINEANVKRRIQRQWKSSKGVDPEESAVKCISISKLARPASAWMEENKRPIQTLMEEIERSPKTNRRAFDYLASSREVPVSFQLFLAIQEETDKELVFSLLLVVDVSLELKEDAGPLVVIMAGQW
ncbi:hypothetical protein Peur_046997 [Populus x canadensis]